MKVKLFVLLCIAALVSGSCGGKKSVGSVQSNDTLTIAPAIESTMMIVAKVSVKPEKASAFIEAAKEMIEKSNTESGCSFYQLFQDPYDNSKFVFVEEYKNQAAVDAHFATEYFKGFGTKIGDLLVGAPEIKIVTVAKEVIQ